MQIDWNEAYSVGVPEIDDQHQELIRRVNQKAHTQFMTLFDSLY